VPCWLAGHETRITCAVFAAGVAAPEVLDEVTADGRCGIVLQRLDGPTRSQLLRNGGMKSAQPGGVLATLYLFVHRGRPRRRKQPYCAPASPPRHEFLVVFPSTSPPASSIRSSACRRGMDCAQTFIPPTGS